MSVPSSYQISSRTRTLAIIGDPIEHSITPRIQNVAWEALRKGGVEADIVNVAFRVGPSNLEAAVKGAQALGLLGLMVTIPHKERVLDFCDELHPSAQAMGAANLLHFQVDGKIVGHSSDGWAAIKSLAEQGVQVASQKICILGGGGAARSLALTYALEGAAEIILLNRTVERAELIAREVLAMGVPARAAALDESTLHATLPECQLLVNATSIGMHPQESETPVPAGVLGGHLAVYDIVYNPLETRLLSDARSNGARAIDGLGMLIYTNVYAAKVCAERELSASVMRQESLKALSHP